VSLKKVLLHSNEKRGRAYLFSLLSLCVLLSIFFVSSIIRNGWHRTTAEVVNGWIKSESVNLQQGNLLSAVSKYQRVIQSSEFLVGITLVQSDPNGKWNELIKLGEPFTHESPPTLKTHAATVVTRGLFEFSAYYSPELPNRDVWIRFDIKPKSAGYTLLSVSIILTLFMILFFSLIIIHEKKELERRQVVIQSALQELISGNKMSNELSSIAPNLVGVWENLHKELEKLKHLKAMAQVTENMAKISRHVAHDIRSPLLALNLILKDIDNLTAAKITLAKSAIKRIQGIANDLLKQNFGSQILTNSPSGKWTSFDKIITLIRQLIAEKEALLAEKHIAVKFDFKSTKLDNTESLIFFDEIEIGRIIDNLINNSIDALANLSGKIEINLAVTNNTLEVSINDNGKGIAADYLDKVWEEGVSIGKDKISSGFGLGLSHCKSVVESWGGHCKIESAVNLGTTIRLYLKLK
jgi:signal transduction histidine kinase